MKFLKSSLFYFLIFGVILCSFFVFLIGKEKSSFSGGSIFDESQYLFSATANSFKSLDSNISENTYLQAIAPPFLVSGKVLASFSNFSQKKEVEEYTVQPGDNLSSIAKKFGITTETLLLANKLSSNSVIQPGQKLIILPVSGLLHVVRKGDTLSEIAEMYQANINKIANINGIGEDMEIFAGDILIIPDGIMPKVSRKYVRIPLSQSYFMCPIPAPCRITQGLHWFNAVDFSNGKCGEPVYAAAGGVIQRTGYTSLGGNYIRILHPNGVITYYGHLSKISAKPGQGVNRGDIIGYVGHTGHTIPPGPAGCHVHFDVRFAKNPFAGYPVGTKLLKK